MKKHFLLLVMALMSMTAWAANLDKSKFVAPNISYGVATTLPVVSVTDYVAEDYEIVTDKFYTSDTGAGETAVLTPGVYTLVAAGTTLTAGTKYALSAEGASVFTAEGDEVAEANQYWEETTAPVNNLKRANAATYFIKIVGKGDTYGGSVIYVDFIINPVSVTIEFDAKEKTFGGVDPAITYTLDPGTYTKEILNLTVFRAEGEEAKTYAYDFTYENNNVTLTRKAGDATVFTINPKAIEPTVTLAAGPYVYSAAAQTPGFTVKDADNKTISDGYELKYKAASSEEWTTSAINVGAYKVKAVPTATSNYTGESAAVDFTIAAAPLSVYVNSFSKEYDASSTIPGTVTFAYSGLKGADATSATPFGAAAFEAKYVTTAIEPGNPGYDADTYNAEIALKKNVSSTGYALKPVKKTITGDNLIKYNNYSVTLLNTGKMTVTPKAIDVKPTEGQSKIYGESDPVFTVDASAALSVDDRTAIAACYTVTRTNSTVNTVGTYEDVLTLSEVAESELTDAQKTAKANYTITKKTGDFAITAATVYVYPKSETITYGDAQPNFTVIATTGSGSTVTLSSTLTVKVQGQETVPTTPGTYVLVVEGTPAAEGYAATDFSILDGQYIINKKTLTPVIAAQAMHVGETEAQIQDKVTWKEGLVGDDVIGYALAFNKGDGDDMIPGAKISGSGTTVDPWTLAATSTGSYAKGIKISEVASTTEKPNQNDYYTIAFADAFGALTVGGATTVNFMSDDNDWTEIVKYGADETKETVSWTPARSQAITASNDGTWKAGKWNTMILPFAIKARDLSKALGYAVVNVVNPLGTSVKDGKINVTFKLKMDNVAIPANTPIAVKTDEDIAVDAVINFENQVMIEKPAAEKVEVDAGLGCKFVGVYKTVKLDKNTPDYHFMANDSWYHFGTNSSKSYNIIPFNCYVDQSGATVSARGLEVSFEELDGSMTAIKAIDADVVGNSTVKEGWYTIGGMKLQGAPAQKGIYIHNGKKIVVK